MSLACNCWLYAVLIVVVVVGGIAGLMTWRLRRRARRAQ